MKNLMLYVFISEMIPFIVALIFYNKLKTKALKVFFYYTIFLASFAVLNYLGTLVFNQPLFVNVLARVYVFLEFVFFSVILSYLINNSSVSLAARWAILPFAVICILDFFYHGGGATGNITFIIEFIVFLMLLSFYFFEKVWVEMEVPIYHNISFWICVGWLIYFAGNFFMLLMMDSLKNPSLQGALVIIYFISTFTKNLILCLAFLNDEKVTVRRDYALPRFKFDD